MKVAEWLIFFKKYNTKNVFSLADIVLLSGEDKSAVSVQLSRLVRSEIVERLARGWYMNPFNRPSSEEQSMVVRRPSYLSLEYALSRQEILSQNAFTFTLVTTKLPYIYRTGDSVLEYHQIKRPLFWGYVREGTVLVAEPEKALLDLIYIRYVRGRSLSREGLDSLMDDMYLEELDRKRLLRYGDEFDRATRRIILESFS